MADSIGRQISVGLGKESSRGVAVAPSAWLRHLSLSFQNKVEKMVNESAMGVVEKNNDAVRVKEWAEGDIELKIQDLSFGHVLLMALGSVSTAANSDSSGLVYDHTFTVSQSTALQSYTLAVKETNADRRYPLAVANNLVVESESGQYAKATLGVVSKRGISASNTTAYTDENEFSSAHATVKFASDEASLGSASAVDVKVVRLELNNNAEPYFALGSTEPNEITAGERELTGEMTLRYTDQTFENLFTSDTKQAVQLELKNTDVTIGTSANPAVRFVMPRVTVTEWERSTDLGGIVEQTVGFTAEFDTSTSKMLSVVLTNLQTSY